MKLTTEYFTLNDKVVGCLDRLNSNFKNKPLKVSDVTDANNNQYVNLVQEGGGVLGVALVGFTYVLEQMNIRFWRLAGTSAGAINTMLLAAINEKNEEKSLDILEELVNVDLLSFVDGHPIVKRSLKSMMAMPNYFSSTLNGIICLLGLTMMSLILSLFHTNTYFTIFVGVLLTIIAILAISFVILWGKLRKSDWGLCRGKVFSKWLEGILKKHGVDSIQSLEVKAIRTDQDLNLTINSVTTGKDLSSDMTVIASDITTKRKVEFPRDITNYTDPQNIQPADLVRASMSIPFFYEPFNIDGNNQKCSFVDGGVISNFPINLFHNPEIKTPRLPVFAIDLDDNTVTKRKESKSSIGGRAMSIFNTVRFHSDKDFLLKHDFYKDYCVAKVDVKGYNWLNFSLTPEEKLGLFVKGAEAATEFLLNFNWDLYKQERAKL